MNADSLRARLRRGARSVLPETVRARARAVRDRGRRRVQALAATRGIRKPPICGRVSHWAEEHTPGVECRILLPAVQVTRDPPRTVEPEVDPVYTTRLVMDVPAKYLVPIAGARLLGSDGLVVLPDGALAAESVFGRGVLEQTPTLYSGLRGPYTSKAGSYFSLLVLWSNTGNYYHWIHDTLSRLYGVVDALPPDTQFLVPPGLTDFQLETLRMFGVEPHQLVPFPGTEGWELETLHFASPTTHSGLDRRDAAQWLRDRILAWYGITPEATGRRIYISRRDAPQRRVANEDAVEEFLAPYGFEARTLGDLSFREQVALLATAEVVVGPHGAGLTNILFAAPGLKVVDVIERNHLSAGYIFWSLAEALDHEYWYLVADSVPRRGLQNDALVSIDRLQATFDRMGLDRRS